ncbi:hypothetical protein ACFOOM_00855 [Streptomyces echinoruber]|uniref:phage tail protein n=1 Tax=Streptomyces echinoruber TaxID=68898 RepID=UPI0016743F5F|nr:hypothetical protein [Streptomyces echinoruber]
MAGEDEDYGSARITIDLDDRGVVADAQQLGQRIQNALNRATNGIARQIRNSIQNSLRGVAVQIRVDPDLSHFDTALLRELRHLDSINIPVSPDLSRFDARLLSGLAGVDSLDIPVAPDVSVFMERLRAALADEEVSIRVVPDLDGLDDRIRRHRPPNVNVDADVDTNRLTRSLAGLAGIAGGVGRVLAQGLKLGAFGIAAVGAAKGVATLTGALAPAVGIVAAFPAAFLGVQAALGTLRLAVAGVSDAFSAALTGDAKEFEKSLEDLTPAARSAAKEVRAFKPALDSLKSSVQQAFFKPLKGDIEAAGKALGGPLKTGMTAVSGELGRLASSVLGFAKSASAVQLVKGVFAGLKAEIAGIKSDSVDRLLKAISGFVSSTLPAFNGLGGVLDRLVNRLAAFLENATKAGKGLSWIQTALTVLQQLGGIAQNIGSILSSVFRAAGDAGGGFLANLQTITGQVAAFLKTASGQSAVGNIFATIGTIATQLGPILSALVTQLGQIAPALAPIFSTLGPAITSLIGSLGPALAAIAPSLQAVATSLAAGLSVIGPSLAPLGAAIGNAVTALAPLLPLAGQLVAVLAQALAPALNAVVVALQPVVEELVAALMPVLPQLGAAFVSLVTAITPLATGVGQALAQLVANLAPLMSTLAGTLAQVAAALVPVVQALTSALLPVLPALVQAFTAVMQALMPLLPAIANLAVALSPLLVMIVNLLAPVVQVAAAFATWAAISVVVPVISTVVSALTGLYTGLASVVTFITQLPSLIMAGLSTLGSLLVSAFNGVVAFFAGLPGMIMAGLSALPGLLASFFHGALVAVGTVIGVQIGLIILLFTRVPGMVLSALSSLASVIGGLFTSAFSRARSLTTSFVSQVAGFLAALPGRAVAVLASLPGRVQSLFRSAGNAGMSAARNFGTQAVVFFAGLPGRVRGALSGAASALTSVGRDLVQGMINGVKAMAGSLVSAAKTVVSSAISAAKSVLKIGSPSRVFMQIGKDTGKGFIIGLTGTASQIKATTEKIAKDITAAFKGKNTRLDDRLLKLVADGNKRLTSLATQRDAIAKKIADAQKFATDTAASALQSFSLQNLTQSGVNGFNIVEGLDQALRQVKSFTKQINDLSKRGLRKDLLQQIIGLGPQQGAQLAQFLSSQSTASLKRINSLQAQLVSATNKLGRDAADDLFDAGKQASKGFLSGLKGQQKDIEDLMLEIAKGMQKAIRSALGIHSPSRVFARIGDLTGQGLQVGLLGRLAAVRKMTRAAAFAVADAVRAPLASLPRQMPGPEVRPMLAAISDGGDPVRLTRRPGGTQAARALAAAAAGGGVTNNFNVTAAQDPEQTARIVMRRLAQAGLA